MEVRVMSMQHLGEDSWPVAALSKGWHRLRETAQHALTRFRQADDEETSPATESVPRWGVLAADLIEHEDELLLRMEVPGMAPKDLQVEALDRTLRVSGQRKTESNRRQGTAIITERAYGEFRRVFSLPAGIDVDAVKAKYRKGVLLSSVICLARG
jgi:HSP20 family protein